MLHLKGKRMEFVLYCASINIVAMYVIALMQYKICTCKRFPYFIDTIVHVVKDNKHSLLTLFIICLDVHVAKNNKCSLLSIHIWLVWLFTS